MAKDNERSIVAPHIKNKAIQMLSPSFGNAKPMEVLKWVNSHVDESTGLPLTVDRSTVFKWRKKARQEFVHPIDKPIDWKNLNYLTSTTTIEIDGIDCEPLNISHRSSREFAILAITPAISAKTKKGAAFIIQSIILRKTSCSRA